MPELPEVEAVCRRIRPSVAGRRILAARLLRPRIALPHPSDQLERFLQGRRIETVTRRAKNILLHLSGRPPCALHLHLRMTGNLDLLPDVRFLPASARFYLEFSGHDGLVFTDPRALGRIRLLNQDDLAALDAALGPEPLSRSFTPARLAAAARASSRPAKLFLLDQKRIAGLGNIYAAEALFLAGIHPAQPMKTLEPARIGALHRAIVDTLRGALRSAEREYSRPGTRSQAEDFPLRVYGREGHPCLDCGHLVHRVKQGGRSTYFCPHCQQPRGA